MTAPTVTVVVVTWNSAATIRRCLDSIVTASGGVAEVCTIVVVDNASYDGTPDLVAATNRVRLECNPQNTGFAAACNRGATGSTSEFLLFLNPDCVLWPGSIDALAAFMADGLAVGICGPAFAANGGGVPIAAARYPSLHILFGSATRLSRLAPGLFPPRFYEGSELARTRRVDQVSGACFFVRRSLFETLGGFDERFFLYYEEADLARRASSLGWESWFVREASCTHSAGASTRQVPGLRLFWNLRSRMIFARKHFGFVAFVVTVLLTLVEATLALARAVRRPREVTDVARGWGRLVGWSARWTAGGAPLTVRATR
jgi:GT2 family glycosyltransferase